MSLTSYQLLQLQKEQIIGYPDQCNKNFFLARSFSPFNLGFMVDLNEVVVFCDTRVNKENIPDFPGSWNGLQIENRGEITKVGAAVDAGLIPFRMAIEKGVDLLICHHGLFWTPPTPITGSNYEKIKLCLDNNLAVYSSICPSIATRKLAIMHFWPLSWASIQAVFLPTRAQILDSSPPVRMTGMNWWTGWTDLFPRGFQAMEFGMGKPEKIAILTGSGQSAVDQILPAGADTLITGELKQHHFNMAQELELNLYTCGHYETENLWWIHWPEKLPCSITWTTNSSKPTALFDYHFLGCESIWIRI